MSGLRCPKAYCASIRSLYPFDRCANSPSLSHPQGALGIVPASISLRISQPYKNTTDCLNCQGFSKNILLQTPYSKAKAGDFTRPRLYYSKPLGLGPYSFAPIWLSSIIYQSKRYWPTSGISVTKIACQALPVS